MVRNEWRDRSGTKAVGSLPARTLLLNGSSRSDYSGPGEMFKSSRLVKITRDVLETEFSITVDLLDL